MPRSLEEILRDADKHADRFEAEFPETEMHDATALRALRAAYEDRLAAEKRLVDAVSVARGYGHSWAAVGAMVGTSGEAARQRYTEVADGMQPMAQPLEVHGVTGVVETGTARIVGASRKAQDKTT